MADATTTERKPVTKPPKAKPVRTYTEEQKERQSESLKNYHANKDKIAGEQIHRLFAYLMFDKKVKWSKIEEGVGYSRGTIYDYRNGTKKSAPHEGNLEKIRKWLDIPTYAWEEFLGDLTFTPAMVLNYAGKPEKPIEKVKPSVIFEGFNMPENNNFWINTSGDSSEDEASENWATEVWAHYEQKAPTDLLKDIKKLTSLLEQKLTFGSTDEKPKNLELSAKERLRLKELLDRSMRLQQLTTAKLTELIGNHAIVQIILDGDEEYQYPLNAVKALIPHLFWVEGWTEDNLPVLHPVRQLKSIEELKDILKL